MSSFAPIPHLKLFADSDALARAAAESIVEAARGAVAERGRFMLGLSGGSTPEKLYRLLAGSEFIRQVDWSRVRLFFGDERFVPRDDADRSNYDMARRTLIAHVPVPPDQVFPMDTTLPTPDDTARAYEAAVRDAFAALAVRDGVPVFDMILLGLGDDGHTASLFPHAAALNRTNVLFTASPPGTLPPPVDRITMTFPILNAAREVLFLIAGAKKAEALQDILENNPAVSARPAAGVTVPDGTLTFFVDTAAAERLSPETKRRGE